jgi:hypothetical protein
MYNLSRVTNIVMEIICKSNELFHLGGRLRLLESQELFEHS